MPKLLSLSLLAALVSAALPAAAQHCPAPVVLPAPHTLNTSYRYDPLSHTHVADTAWLHLSRGDKEGLISMDGRRIIEPQYDPQPFSWEEGLMWVSKDGKWGALDAEGREVIAPQFAAVLPFKDGLAIVGDEPEALTRVIDTGGKVVLAPENIDGIDTIGDGLLVVKIGDKYGYMNLEGELVIEAKYNYASAFFQGIALVDDQNGERMLAIDKSGTAIIAPSSGYIMRSTDGYFAAVDDEGQMNLFNAAGEQLFDKTYELLGGTPSGEDDNFTVFIDGATVAYLDGKAGLLDQQGKAILPFEYEDLQVLEGGLLIAVKDDKFGLIDRQGKVIIPFEYEWFVNYHDVFVVSKQLPDPNAIKNNATRHYWGVMDREGREVIPVQYEDVRPLSNQLFVVNTAWENAAFQLFDAAGKPVSERTWDYIGEGLEGMLEVSKDRRWGFIDEQGEVLIEPKYDYVSSVKPDRIIAKQGGREMLLDRNGCVIIDMAGHWKK